MKSIRSYLGLAGLTSLLWGSPLPAAAATMTPTDEMAAYLRLILGLFAVLGIILVLYAVVRKRFSLLGSRSGSAIKIIEIRPFMPKKSLCLIEVKGKEYLLGVSSEHISLLADLNTPPVSFNELLKESSQQEQP